LNYTANHCGRNCRKPRLAVKRLASTNNALKIAGELTCETNKIKNVEMAAEKFYNGGSAVVKIESNNTYRRWIEFLAGNSHWLGAKRQ
jgi:hypothetical protein